MYLHQGIDGLVGLNKILAVLILELAFTGLVEATAQKYSQRQPSFYGHIENKTVPVGRDVILGCQVENLGKDYKVGWLKVSDQTILTLHKRVITHNHRIHVTHDEHRTWNLLIKNVEEQDAGCYMCQINTATMQKQLGCINVLVPPDINPEKTSSDTTVKEGDDATLVCHASGQPPPTIIWRRENGEPFLVKKSGKMVKRYVGEFLVLHKVRRKDMGAFMCIASNNVPPSVSKRILLNVNFAPSVNVNDHLIGCPLGKEVRLKCVVEAFPHAITYWVRASKKTQKQEMLLNRPRFNITEERLNYKADVVLTISEFRREDIGMYTCVSTNSLGYKEATVRLYEIEVVHTEESTLRTEAQTTAVTTTTKATESPVKNRGYNVEKKSGDQKSVLRNSNNRQKNSRKNSYFSSSAQANSGSTLINFFLQIFILKFITSIKKNA